MELVMITSIPRIQVLSNNNRLQPDAAEHREEEISLTSTLSKRIKRDCIKIYQILFIIIV
jgi:hypothetical protein